MKERYSVTVTKDDPLRVMVDADEFCATLFMNVNNLRLNDTEFRQFVRNSLGIVTFDRPDKPLYIYMDRARQRTKQVFQLLEAEYPSTTFILSGDVYMDDLDGMNVVWISSEQFDLNRVKKMQDFAYKAGKKLRKRK